MYLYTTDCVCPQKKMAAIVYHRFLLVTVLVVILGVTWGTDCPDNWVAFKGSCYLFAHGLFDTFYKAEHFCHNQSGYLVHVDDAVENAFLEQRIRTFKNESFWMGLADDIKDGEWRWTDDNTLAEFFDWGPHEPNGHARENCAHFFVAEKFHWNDAPCDYLKNAPLCEIKRSGYSEIVG